MLARTRIQFYLLEYIKCKIRDFSTEYGKKKADALGSTRVVY